jgi:hypothetical protein
MGYFRPSDYDIKNALMEIGRYESIYVGDNYVMKDHGDYVELNIDADNEKGHISFDLYFDDNGKLVSWNEHK